MKKLLFAAILLSGGQAFGASALIHLDCGGQRNLIFDSIRGIAIRGDELRMSTESSRGDIQGYAGKLTTSVSSANGPTFNLSTGISVTIPNELLEGKVNHATVQFSSLDYPYETAECSLVR